MGRLPEWLVAGLVVGLLGWVGYTTHTNARSISAIDAKVNFLVRFIVPDRKQVRISP